MDQPFAKFYTGIFHSQFVSSRVLDQKAWKFLDLRLEQRFVLKVEREITLEEFESARMSRVSTASREWQSKSHPGYEHHRVALQPHVLLTDNNDIELVFMDGSAVRELCSELYVEYGEDAVPAEFTSQDFIANKDGGYHGRMTGRGYVRIPILTEEAKALKRLEIMSREGKRRTGCLSPFIPGRSGLSLITGRGLGRIQGAARGGCARSGCGLLSLFMLIGLLLSLWKGCSHEGADNRRVIHDTVYVDENSKKEVIKQFLDTTTIFKTEAVELPNVQFYTNSSKLLPYSINSIQQLGDYLIAHPQIHAVIEGHTDNTGDPAENLRLSQERAETVRQVLISFGIDPERIEAKGYGKNHPRADNSTVEGRALNRRVEVRLTNTERSETKSTEVQDGG